MTQLRKLLVTALFKGYTDKELEETLRDNKTLYLYVDQQHKVQIDYVKPIKGKRLTSVTLHPAGKEIRVDSTDGTIGNKVQPITQQLLKFLEGEKLIDKTWNVLTNDYSKYVGNDFKTFQSKYKDFNFLTDPRNRISDNMKDIVLYHGTSDQDWEKIQKQGLFPLLQGPNKEGGFESRHKHEGNENVLYLTGDLHKAQDYAKARVSSLQLKAKKAGQFITREPVILEVKIPDPRKLVADDDIVNGVAREQSRKLWDKKPEEEKKRLMAELTKKMGWEIKDDSTATIVWRETDEGFNEIMNTIPKQIYKAWKASLKRTNQVGYKGKIPPSYITKLD